MVVRVNNPSKKVTRDPKYWLALFNADSDEGSCLEILPIPVQTGDYIRPGDNWGPQRNNFDTTGIRLWTKQT